MLLFLVTFIFGVSIKGSINWVYIGIFLFSPQRLPRYFCIFIAAYYKLVSDSVFEDHVDSVSHESRVDHNGSQKP